MNETAPHIADMSAPSDVQGQRLRRAFQRVLNHRPTTYQRSLINTAASLTAKSEAAAHNPSISLTDVVRLHNAASRARDEMFASFEANRQSDHEPSYDELVRAHGL